MFRKRRPAPPPEPTDPIAALDRSAVPVRYLTLVDQAIDAQQRWQVVSAGIAAGPLADRLTVLGDQVRAGVAELHGATVRVGEVERLLAALDPAGATAAYKDAKRRSIDGPVPELDALEARFASIQRMMNVVADADEHLRLLDARLLAAVARCAEVAVMADSAGLAAAGSDLEHVVSELGSLRSALAEMR